MVLVVQLPALQPGRRPAETPFPGRQRGRAGRAAMAVGKDVLELDLYGLLGIGEKASEKEVRAGGRSYRAPSSLPALGGSAAAFPSVPGGRRLGRGSVLPLPGC